MRRCVGVVLAGGGATRFGGAPKGLEIVGGRRMIDAVAASLLAATDELLLVANAPGSDGWLPGVRTVSDPMPGIGSLGGLHAALAHAAPGDALVVAWDMPFVPTTLLRALRECGERGDADAVVPRHGALDPAQGDAEPLCAWYAAGCLTTTERLVHAGERRAGALADAVKATWLAAAAYGDPAHMFVNVNTPGELARARDLPQR